MFTLVDWLFPKYCFGCKRQGTNLCANCASGLLARQSFVIFYNKFGLKRTVCVFAYRGVMKKMLQAYKYRYLKNLEITLTNLTVVQLARKKAKLPTKATLVAVPMHWHKQNIRGYNQVEELARLMAQKLGWDFCPNLLVKKQTTIPQAGLNRTQRLKNIQGTFAVNPKQAGKVSGPLVIFDDVVTTGSTLSEVTKVLHKKGFTCQLGLVLLG